MTQRLELFTALALLLTPLASCSDAGPRVYTAQFYDSDAACLAEYEAIGLVEADTLPASCEPACLELAGTLYVSTVCPPYPDTATPLTPEESPECAAALLAEPCE